MGDLWRLVARPTVLLICGFIAAIYGVFAIKVSRASKVPERSDLTKVEGPIKTITKRWKEDKRFRSTDFLTNAQPFHFDVKYEIAVDATIFGQTPSLTLSSDEVLSLLPGAKEKIKEMTNSAASSPASNSLSQIEQQTDVYASQLYGTPVAMLVHDKVSDPWEIVVGAATIKDFSVKHDKLVEEVAEKVADGRNITGIGLAVALFGGVWYYMKEKLDWV
jgi:hypothetical protein